MMMEADLVARVDDVGACTAKLAGLGVTLDTAAAAAAAAADDHDEAFYSDDDDDDGDDQQQQQQQEQQENDDEEHEVQQLCPHAAELARRASLAVSARAEDWDLPPHPLIEEAAPTRAQFDHPETAPVVVMRNPIAGMQRVGGVADPGAPVPVNTPEPVEFESDLFVGRVSVQLRGLKSTDEPRFFAGKRRFLHIVVQGRYKADVRAADHWTGQEFFKISNALPPAFLSLAFACAAKMFSSSVRVSARASPEEGRLAGFMNPLLASAQQVNVAMPGDEPADLFDFEEDARLLSDKLADKRGKPLSAAARRKWFDCAANREAVTLTPAHVFTFALWSHHIDVARYRLNMNSWLNFSLLPYSEGIPMQLMAKDTATGSYTLNLLLWHKGLLYKDEDGEGGEGALARLRRGGLRGLLGSSKA